MHSLPFRHLCLCVLLGAYVVTGLGAQAQVERPVLAPRLVAEGEAPKIDGSLDDAAWKLAPLLSGLTQVVPIEGAAPTTRTEVRICYDRDYLYLSFRCFDDPSRVRARLMERDARLDPDDRVEWWIDTFDDQRFGYWFQIGAGGSKGDALMSDSGERFNKSWDGIWLGEARVTEEGWQAEVALPFKTLAFRAGHDTWGFNMRRIRKDNDEEQRWASPAVAYRFFQLSEGGRLTGLEGMRQGLGVDLVPYIKSAASRDRRVDDHTHRSGDFGFDVNYRITPSLNFRLTYNTDFAETEVDLRQVNLTRFRLFFPEKRDFFLEDSGLFEFGAPARRRDTLAYFSRRIGLDSGGSAVPILFGTKLSGRVGEWNLGLQHTVLDETEERDEKGLGVVRVSRNLGGENSVGMIYTGGNPNESGFAQTVGVDFRFGDSRAFGPGRGLSFWGFAMGSDADATGSDGSSFGLQGEFRSAMWRHGLEATTVSEDFDPKLGFVRRTDINRYRWNTSLTWRSDDDGWLRRANWRLSPTMTTSQGGELQSWALPLRWFELTFRTEDQIQFESHQIFDHLGSPFEIHPGVIVATGDYAMTRHFAEVNFSQRRAVSGEINVEYGDFWDGDLFRWRVEPEIIPNRYLQVAGAYSEHHVDLSNGSFVTRLASMRMNLAMSPDLSWNNLGQYDTDSKALSLQSRIRWIMRPGSELFLVGVYGWEKEDHYAPLVPTTQDLSLKIVHTIRF